MHSQRGRWERGTKMLRKFLTNFFRKAVNIRIFVGAFYSGIQARIKAASTFKAQRRFLGKILVEITESNGDPQVVYPLLEANLNKLDESFIEVLRDWATTTLTKAKPDLRHYMAVDIGTFCQLMEDFPRGNRATNLEIAIVGSKIILDTVFTQEDFLEYWAGTQNILGNAYRNRILGEKAENLETALHCFTPILKKVTCVNFPELWAMTHNNIGNTYFDRILGEKAQNLEEAIRCWKAASEVFTHNDFPDKWAMTQLNLGNGYAVRLWGDKAENIECAINYYKTALKEYTFENYPEDWAMIQVNLGNTYTNRLQGDFIKNLEEASHCFSIALKVFIREQFPEDWANTLSNLSNTYNEQGNFYYEQSNYENSLKFSEKSISGCQSALEVYTYDSFPEYWAMTQYNLGRAYYELGLIYRTTRHEKVAENLETAIQCYQSALKVYTRKQFPHDWAIVKNSLGLAYRERMQGNSKDMEEAIRCFHAALEIYTCEKFPEDYANTNFNLGLVYLDIEQFDKAYNVLKLAINTVESLRSEITSGDVIKQKFAEKWHRGYQNMVEACLNLASADSSHYLSAIEYVERSKTRNLVELILNRDLKIIFPPEIVSQLEKLQNEIISDQYQLQNALADTVTLMQHLQQLRQKRNNLLSEHVHIGSNFKFNEFQELLDDHTAVVEFYIIANQLIIFIFTNQTHQPIIVWQSESEELERLGDWGDEYLMAYNQSNSKWREQLVFRLDDLAKIIHINEIIAKIPQEYNRLILVPYVYLHLFPLHALPLADGKCLLDKFDSVRYAPSCQLLQQVQKQQRPNLSDFLAVQNPTNDLPYADLEVEVIRSFFSADNVLAKLAATKTALDDNQNLSTTHCTHFACHGEFNLASPLESALKLANEERLTLADIFGLTLNQCRLVTLSACETGLTDPTSISDEYIGLPSGFLYAGCANVVSSLWTVNQVSTAFLMIKFYQNLKENQSNVAKALNDAQCWLRDVTQQQLLDWVKQLNLAEDKMAQIEDELDWYDSDEKPYNDPYHWAAFCAIGQ
jgi:CHAT domain-containing protein